MKEKVKYTCVASYPGDLSQALTCTKTKKKMLFIKETDTFGHIVV